MLDVVKAREMEFTILTVHLVFDTRGVVVFTDLVPVGQQFGAVLAESVLELVLVVGPVHDQLLASWTLNLQFGKQIHRHATNLLEFPRDLTVFVWAVQCHSFPLASIGTAFTATDEAALALDSVAQKVIAEEALSHGGEVVWNDVRVDHDSLGDGEGGTWIDSVALVALHEFTSRQNGLAELAWHLGLFTVELNMGLHAHFASLEAAIALVARTHTTANLFVLLNCLK